METDEDELPMAIEAREWSWLLLVSRGVGFLRGAAQATSDVLDAIEDDIIAHWQLDQGFQRTLKDIESM